MPKGLPSNSPSPTPAAGPALAATAPAEEKMPPRGTAVLARAKTGMMKKVERGDSLQPYGRQAATACDRGCNRVEGRLQPCGREAATVCNGGCNRVEGRGDRGDE